MIMGLFLTILDWSMFDGVDNVMLQLAPWVRREVDELAPAPCVVTQACPPPDTRDWSGMQIVSVVRTTYVYER